MKRKRESEVESVTVGTAVQPSVNELVREALRTMTQEERDEFAREEDAAAEVRDLEQNWFQTSRHVPLDLLVKTAATLRASAKSDSHAADAAMRLIDTCARLLEFNERKRAYERHVVEELDALAVHPTSSVEYRRAIKLITSQDRHDRAEEHFLSFIEADVHFNGSQRGLNEKAEVNERVALYESRGIEAKDLIYLRAGFEWFRDMGWLGKRKRPQKNDLAESSGEKSATNARKSARKPRSAAE